MSSVTDHDWPDSVAVTIPVAVTESVAVAITITVPIAVAVPKSVAPIVVVIIIDAARPPNAVIEELPADAPDLLRGAELILRQSDVG